MLHDLRYAWRALVKRPSFAAGTILVLSLAVGVNTAVFSIVNAVLLRPLPVPNADRLAFVYAHSTSSRQSNIWYGAYRDLRQKVDVFGAMAATTTDIGRLRQGTDVIPLQGEAVTAGYFELLGVAPKIGRTIQADDDRPSAAPVALISEALWKAQFAGDAKILGRTLRIDAGVLYSSQYADTWRDYTIVGVMPASFPGTGNPWQPAQYWVPIEARSIDRRAAPGGGGPLEGRSVVAIGRLEPGATIGQAAAAVDVAGRDILQHSSVPLAPDLVFQVLSARRVLLPFQGPYYMDVPRILTTLGAIATLLLMIAGTNLGGMLLARGVSRRSEIAIRLSLGVRRGRLVRQLLIESLLVAIAAGGAGLLLARALVAAALRGFPSQIPGSNAVAFTIDVPIDAHVIAFAFASGLVTAVVVGLAPAAQALRVDLLAALSASTPTATRSRRRLRRLVLVPQIALAVVLIFLSGVFMRSLLRLELAPQGYAPEHVVMLETQFPQRHMTGATFSMEQFRQEGADMLVAQDRILNRLTSVAGVASAALTMVAPDDVPLPMMVTSIVTRTDYETTRRYRGVTLGYASAGYFDTLGIRLLRGRVFDARDRDGTASSAVVTQTLADQLWPARDPIGQQMAIRSAEDSTPIRWVTIVGEVASVTRPAEEQPRPVVYLPIESAATGGTTFLVRGAGNPARLAAAAKQAIGAAEPDVIVTRTRPLQAVISDLRYPRRFTAGLISASGLTALLLAAIGVFALMSYAVAQRAGEIGVRMVLGADRRDIVRLIVRDGAWLAVAGIGFGFALAFAAIRFASHAIVPLPDQDAATFVAVPLILAAVVLAACYFPARRAARVDPLVVLRNA
jgi:putative ABC transport system permease protein